LDRRPREREVKVAVIGGSGLEELLEGPEEIRVGTPFGIPPKITVGEVEGIRIAILPRHGPGHELPPHKVNYRANIWALRALGAERILATNAVGAINPDIRPGDLVIPHDIIDFTRSRAQTFYEGPDVVHVDVSEPFCPELRSLLVEEAVRRHDRVHDKAVLVCTEGPRFETPAEIRAFRILGCDIVGMTTAPEAFLARELEMCYATLCFVSNMAAGMQARLTATEVLEVASRVQEVMRDVLVGVLRRLPEERSCPCSRALEGARMRK